MGLLALKKTKKEVRIDFPEAKNADGTIPAFIVKELDYSEEYETTDKIELTATCIIGWENYQDEDGKDVAFSYEEALSLLTESSVIFTKVGNTVFDAKAFIEKKTKPKS